MKYSGSRSVSSIGSFEQIRNYVKGRSRRGRPENDSFLALTSARVLMDQAPFEPATLLIVDDTIAAIGAGIHTDLPGFKQVDLGGLTVLPGLIDLHTHLSFTPRVADEIAPTLNDRPPTKPELALRAGTTTARDMGGFEHTDLMIRDEIAAGRRRGPRMLAAGRIITRQGGYLDGLGVGVSKGDTGLIEAVRGQIEAGVDQIKIMGSGGVTGGMDESYFSEREYRLVVDVAAESHVPVAVHAHSTVAIKAAVRAGVTSIEHGSFLDQEGARMMLDVGTFLVPTFAAYSYLASETRPDGVSENAREILRRKFASFRIALETGVQWGLGSDVEEDSPPDLLIREAEFFVDKLGVSPGEVLQTLGAKNAVLLGLDDEIGSIRQGMLADLVIVRGNPMIDVGALRNVVITCRGGALSDW